MQHFAPEHDKMAFFGIASGFSSFKIKVPQDCKDIVLSFGDPLTIRGAFLAVKCNKTFVPLLLALKKRYC